MAAPIVGGAQKAKGLPDEVVRGVGQKPFVEMRLVFGDGDHTGDEAAFLRRRQDDFPTVCRVAMERHAASHLKEKGRFYRGGCGAFVRRWGASENAGRSFFGDGVRQRGKGNGDAAGGDDEKLCGAGKEFPCRIVGQRDGVRREPAAIISHLNEMPAVAVRAQEDHRLAGIDGGSLQPIVLKRIVPFVPCGFRGKLAEIAPAKRHRSARRHGAARFAYRQRLAQHISLPVADRPSRCP